MHQTDFSILTRMFSLFSMLGFLAVLSHCASAPPPPDPTPLLQPDGQWRYPSVDRDSNLELYEPASESVEWGSDLEGDPGPRAGLSVHPIYQDLQPVEKKTASGVDDSHEPGFREDDHSDSPAQSMGSDEDQGNSVAVEEASSVGELPVDDVREGSGGDVLDQPLAEDLDELSEGSGGELSQEPISEDADADANDVQEGSGGDLSD